MKRNCRLFLLVVVCFSAFSCRHLNNSTGAGSVSLTLPYFTDASESRAINTPDGESFLFKITLQDSNGVVYERNAYSGDTVVFDEIPFGIADVDAVAIASSKAVSFIGEGSVNVVEGINEAVVGMREITITLKIKGAAQENRVIRAKDISLDDFLESLDYIPSGKEWAWWYDERKKTKVQITQETFVDFVSNLKESIELKAVYGVRLENLGNYLAGTDVFDGDEIIIINGTVANNKIPNYNSSKSSNAKNLILDFTDCTSLTGIDSNAFYWPGSASVRWVSVLKLPASIQTIGNIQGVVDALYLQMPDNGTINNTYSFDSSCNNTGNTAYDVHFAGTLADWCGRMTGLGTYCAHPLYSAQSDEKNRDLWVLDENGNEYNIKGKDIVIESVYTDKSGKKVPLKTIAEYTLRHSNANSITIPDTVTRIEHAAFADCAATKIYCPKSVNTILNGAFFYDLGTKYGTRSFYYGGTIKDWLRIKTTSSPSTEGGEGGPIRGTTDFFVNNGAGYVNALDNDGSLTIYIEPEYPLTNHFQGWYGIKTLVIRGTWPKPTYVSNQETIKSCAFFSCKNLTDIYLYASFNTSETGYICTVGNNNVFNNSNKVNIHVPADLLSSYTEGEYYPNNNGYTSSTYKNQWKGMTSKVNFVANGAFF